MNTMNNSYSEEKVDEDVESAVLEAMLLKAERLAMEIQGNSSVSVPGTIEMKDNTTDSYSSVGGGVVPIDTSSIARIFSEEQHSLSSDYVSKSINEEEEEKKSCEQGEIGSSGSTIRDIVSSSSYRNSCTTSAVSSSNVSIAESVDIAVKAAQAMQLQLKAVIHNTTTKPPDSPKKKQQQQQQQDEQPPLLIHTTCSLKDEDMTTTSEDDNNIDLSKAFPLSPASSDVGSREKLKILPSVAVDHRSRNLPRSAYAAAEKMMLGIKWEKMSSASEGDEDYVPIKDYSNLTIAQGQDYDDFVDEEQTRTGLTYSQHRAAIRRRRKKRRRRMVVVTFTALLATYYMYNRGVVFNMGNEDMVTLAISSLIEGDEYNVIANNDGKELLSVIENVESLADDKVVTKDDIISAIQSDEYTTDDKNRIENNEQTLKKQEDKNVSDKDESSSDIATLDPVLCDIPIASLVLPHCRKGKRFKLLPTIRKEQVEELVDLLLQ